MSMNMSEEANKYVRDKIQCILDTQCRIPVRPMTPISFYYKTSDSLLDEADHQYNANQLEASFILYSRYITLFVEELKVHHPDFSKVSINDRERVKDIIRTKVFPRAEELKAKLKEKYTQEYEKNNKKTDTNNEDNSKVSVTTLSSQPTTIDHGVETTVQKKSADFLENEQSQKSLKSIRVHLERSITGFPNINLSSFRQISIPSDITEKFLQISQRNTNENIKTFAFLAGIKNENDQYVLTHIIVPKQTGGESSCDTKQEEEIIENIFNDNLINFGWIQTHPQEKAFLTSDDIHMHLTYQMLIKEAIAIVISPKFNETSIFSLTMDAIIPNLSNFTGTNSHHLENDSSLYTIAKHVNYDSNLKCQIIDLRN